MTDTRAPMTQTPVTQNPVTQNPVTQPPMTAGRFVESVLRPTLEDMNMWSPAAEKLMLMIAAHESQGFLYRKQVGGPALSYFQIEPATLDDLYNNYLIYRADKQALLDRYRPEPMKYREALERRDDYACAAARLILWRVKAPLPEVGDEVGMALYAKRYWNTPKGKATAEKYLDDYHRYKPEDY